MITNLNELAKFVKGGAEVLQKAIESEEEVSLDFVEGNFVSDTELDTLKQSVFNEGKKEGGKISYDHAMKDIKKDFNIELEGKDRAKIVEAIQNKIMSDAKIEPDKKVNELKSSLENLQKKYENDLSTKESELSQLSNKLNNFKVNGDLAKELPENLNGIDHNDFLTLAKTTANFDYEDGQLVVKKGDKILRDKMEKPIAPKDYMTEFATNKGWINSDGRGGGDNNHGNSNVFNSMNDVYKHMEENNINPMSTEGQKLVEEFNNTNK
jgi:ribosomal protein S13